MGLLAQLSFYRCMRPCRSRAARQREGRILEHRMMYTGYMLIPVRSGSDCAVTADAAVVD